MAFHREMGMWCQLHFNKQITVLTATDTRSPLPLQADVLTIPHTSGYLHLERPVAGHQPALLISLVDLELNLFLTAVERFFQKQRQPGVDILSPHGMALAETTKTAGVETAGTAPATAENLLEEVTELAGIGFGIAPTAKTGRTLPAGRRFKGAVGTGTVFAELVILGPLFRVFEYFVGFAQILELFVGVGLLADVRMILARQLPIGLFDLLGRGRFPTPRTA